MILFFLNIKTPFLLTQNIWMFVHFIIWMNFMYFNSPQCISILGLGDDEKIIEEDEDSLLGLKACLQHHIALENELPDWAEQRLDQGKNVLANLRCTIPDTHMWEKETILERKTLENIYKIHNFHYRHLPLNVCNFAYENKPNSSVSL